MSLRRLALSCLSAGFILAPLLQAQQSQWQNLTQVRPGTKIQVVENSLRSTSGKFVGFSETDLTLRVEDKEVVIPKDQVHRVTISGKNRKRNTLIGLAVGTGLGGAWSAGMRHTENWRTGDTAGLMGGCAGIGAGIGAMVPAAKTVYKAELPKSTGKK